jgi:hypothetical protein
MTATFNESAYKAAAAMFEKSTGVKLSAADLTFMDGDEWPAPAAGERVIGEMDADDFALFKAMVETAQEREKMRRRIVGVVMRRAGERLERGEEPPAMPGSGLLGLASAITGATPDDVPMDLLHEQMKLDDLYEAMSHMLYFGLKSRFNHHGDTSLGVRRGGKVISTRKELKS